MSIYQPQQSVLKRHLGQRQTACIRNMSVPQRSHTTVSLPVVVQAGLTASEVRIGFGMKESLPGSGMLQSIGYAKRGRRKW
jgi:hypothetical protein